MEYLKWFWIVTLVFALGYTFNDYLESSFNDLLLVMCLGIAA